MSVHYHLFGKHMRHETHLQIQRYRVSCAFLVETREGGWTNNLLCYNTDLATLPSHLPGRRPVLTHLLPADREFGQQR